MNNGKLAVAPSGWLRMNSETTTAILYWPPVVFMELREMIESGNSVYKETWFNQHCQIMMCDIPTYYEATRILRQIEEHLKKTN